MNTIFLISIYLESNDCEYLLYICIDITTNCTSYVISKLLLSIFDIQCSHIKVKITLCLYYSCLII